MITTAVEQILRQIDELSDSERIALTNELASRDEAEWQRLAAEARREARERGIGETEIEQAVNAICYCS